MTFPKKTCSTPMKRGWFFIALIVVLIGTTGCTGINRFLHGKALSSPDPSAHKKLDKAQKAMRNKQYGEAEKLYESLAQTKHRAAVIREARYGLACISLLTAKDLAQYREGLHGMQTWAENTQWYASKEDPRYLLPLLEERVQTLEALQECREDNKASQKRISELEETHNATLTKLRELRLEQKSLRRERKELLRERKQLRQKIRELENLYNELLDTRKDL